LHGREGGGCPHAIGSGPHATQPVWAWSIDCERHRVCWNFHSASTLKTDAKKRGYRIVIHNLNEINRLLLASSLIKITVPLT